MNWQKKYIERFYGSRPGWHDGTTEFHSLCARFSKPNCRILEVGSGPSNETSRFLATLGELHGVDPSPEIRENDALVSGQVVTGDRFPFEDESFDLCVSNWVVEHVVDPTRQLAEVRRILKPGGAYVFRTPNRFHYVTLVAALTPQWFHELVANRLRNLPGEAHDPYPVLYRMNSASAIRRRANEAGLTVAVLSHVEKEPSYGLAARPLFLAFMLYERLVNASEWLAFARVCLFVALVKPLP